jgi:hypothetical protein
MDKILFVRRDYDTSVNRYWPPITNTWTALSFTNNVPYLQTISRVVTQPDLLIDAGDMANLPLDPVISHTVPYFDTSGAPVNQGASPPDGPGTIQPPGTGQAPLEWTFNIQGPYYINDGPFFLSQETGIPGFLWGSFDGTTNPPVLYPSYTSITNYENHLVMQGFPLTLPNGQDGVAYTFSYTNSANGVFYSNNQLSGAGGTPPYTFSVTPGVSLPPGLIVQSSMLNGTNSYFLTGTPTAVGAFSFSIRMTDAGARTIDSSYAITISPP